MFFRESTIVSIIKAGVYAVLFLPLVVLPVFIFPFATTRGFFFQIIVEIVFALWVALAVKNPAYRPKKTLLLGAFALYFTALFLSAVFGLDLYRSFFGNFERMWGFFQLSHFFLFFIVLTGVFKTAAEWRKLIIAALVAGALSACAAAVQFFWTWAAAGFVPRASGLIGNPAFLASYLLFPFLFSLLFFVRGGERARVSRQWFAALAAFSLFAILATATRGAAVALAAAGFFGAVFCALFSKIRALKYGGMAVVALFVLTSIMFFASGNLFEKPVRVSQERFYGVEYFDAPVAAGKSGSFLSRIANISLYDVTVQTRLIAWRSALSEIKERPLSGAGPENFILAFNKNFDPAFYSYERSEIWFDRAHNIYIDMLVMHGWIGFAAYLFLFAAVFWTIVVRYKRRILGAPHAFVFALFFIAYAAQNLFLFDSFSAFLMFVFALAYLNNISTIPETLKETKQTDQPSLFPLLVPLLVAAASIYFFAAKPMAQSYYLSRAESGKYNIEFAAGYYQKAMAAETFGTNEARSRFALAVAKHIQGLPEGPLPQTTAKLLDDATNALKKNIEQSNDYHLLYRLQLSDLYNLKLSRTGMASPEIEEIIRKSIAISPGRMEFEFALAQAEFLKGNYEKSIEILTAASKKNPDHSIPYWKIAQNYHFMGDDEKAIPYLERALYLGHDIRDAREVMWAEKWYVEREDYAKIIYTDRRMLALKPETKEAIRLHMNMAVVYAKLGKKEKAIEHAQAIARLDPAQKEAVDNFIKELNR